MHDEENQSIDIVFCAVDFSDTAALALIYATRLAQRHGAAIVLGHVVESLPVVPYPTLEMPPEGGLELRRWAGEMLEQEAETIRAIGLDVSVVLEDGRPGPKLIDMAAAAKAKVFVIGTRGLSGFEHLILGSTAETVLRLSPIPVMTIHPGDAPPRESIDTVIIPTDLSEHAGEAAAIFASFSKADPNARAILVFADSAPPYLQPFRHELLAHWHQPDGRKEEIQAQMEPTLEKLRDVGFSVEIQVLDGDPVQAVTQYAATKNADMILMTTHGRSALTNVLTGKTAQRIVQHAPCPVLTVRSSSD